MPSPDNPSNPYEHIDIDDPITRMRTEVILLQSRNDYTRRTVSFTVLVAFSFFALFCAIFITFSGLKLIKAESQFVHQLIEQPMQQQSVAAKPAVVVGEQSMDKSVVTIVTEAKPKVDSIVGSGDYLPKAFSSSLIFMSVLASMFLATAVTCALAASKIFPGASQDKSVEQSGEITLPVLSAATELVKLISDLGKK